MMQRLTLPMLSMLSSLVVLSPGCDKVDAQKAPAPDEAPQAEHQAPKDHAASNDFGLTLDGEKRWQMDAHTRTATARLAKIVEGGVGKGTVDEHHAVAAELDAEIQVLVTGCTMKGRAHDMLHVYRMELFPRVDTLTKSKDVKVLATTFADLVDLMAAYPRFFE